jgi:hypothetical protein
MVPVFWLALLFGYLVGAGGAVLFLPSELIEPLYGGLAATTVVVVVVAALAIRRHQRRQSHRPQDPASSPLPRPTPPGGGHAPGNQPLAPSARPPRTRPTLGSGASTRSASAWPVPTAVAPAATLGVEELRQALFEGRVRIEMRSLTSLPGRRGSFHHASARLCDVHGRPLPARRYRPTLTRCGLLGVFDRLVVVHARQALARAEASRPDGPAAAGLRLVCAIHAGSLEEPSLMAELEQMAVEDRPLLSQIVLELDRRRLDGATRERIGRLRRLGIRFCLHRLDPDCRAAIGRGFDFIRIEMAPARLAVVDAERDLALATLTAAGLTVLVDGGEPAGLVEIGQLPWSFETTQQSAA